MAVGACMLDGIMTRPVLLILVSAAAYASATVAMRSASQGWGLVPVLLIAVFLSAAVVAEIAALRSMTLGATYLAILGIETLVVIAVATFLGEGLQPKEWFAATLILSGTALLSHSA